MMDNDDGNDDDRDIDSLVKSGKMIVVIGIFEHIIIIYGHACNGSFDNEDDDGKYHYNYNIVSMILIPS